MVQAQQLELFGVLGEFLLQGRPHPEPTGQQEAALGPAKYPGDGPQAGEVLGATFTAGRATGDLQLADLFDRGHLLEEGHQVRVVVHEGPVVVPGAGRQPPHQVIPAGGVVYGGTHQAVLQHGGCHRFQVVEGQFGQGILRGQHLSLFGDLDAAAEGAAWLGQDRLVGRPPTPAHGAAAAMEDPQGHPVLDGQPLEGNLGFMDLPVAGEEAGILVAV